MAQTSVFLSDLERSKGREGSGGGGRLFTATDKPARAGLPIARGLVTVQSDEITADRRRATGVVRDPDVDEVLRCERDCITRVATGDRATRSLGCAAGQC